MSTKIAEKEKTDFNDLSDRFKSAYVLSTI